MSGAGAESITVAQLLAACGSSDHDIGNATLDDVQDALSEAHPAVAGRLVTTLKRSIDLDDSATASGSEHPDWHDALRRAKQQSMAEGYD